MTEYDIVEIFREMETDLINSMVRNLKKHLKDEDIEGINWSQYQTEMLKGLDEYRKNNKEIVGRYDERTMKNLETLLKTTYKGEALKQERDILRNIVNGARPSPC